MNKLKQYRDKQAKDTWEGCHGCDANDENMRNTGFKEGFNFALALQLPVKFLHFIDYHTSSVGGNFPYRKLVPPHKGIANKTYTPQELYDYWINKIYKPE